MPVAARKVSQLAFPAVSTPNQVMGQPKHGALTLYGYGIAVRVDRGHLVLEDGIGAERRHARLPRVGHGLKRLVVSIRPANPGLGLGSGPTGWGEFVDFG